MFFKLIQLALLFLGYWVFVLEPVSLYFTTMFVHYHYCV